MEKPKLKYQIFDLTADKFADLCHDLLKVEYGYDKSFITDKSNDNRIDILALKGLEKTGIRVLHKYRIYGIQLSHLIENYKPLLEIHHKFIFITSAQIEKKDIKTYESDKISIISQKDVIKLLDKHNDIA